MSPRGAKKDMNATIDARADGDLLDVNSFISTTGHLYLKGDDIGRQRAAVMERDKWTCQECDIIISDYFFETHQCKAEMDHIKNKPWERCDCMHNLRAICHKCHGIKHRR